MKIKPRKMWATTHGGGYICRVFRNRRVCHLACPGAIAIPVLVTPIAKPKKRAKAGGKKVRRG